jgi:serine/threonine-protein kinase
MVPDDPTATSYPDDPEPHAGRAGKYRIVGPIGRGGMGIVYRAVDDDLGRTVALKFIPAELGRESTAAQRFLREARAASALDHVNIGTIFGVEETEHRRRFIVMAYYEGRDLSDRIKDQSQPLSPGDAIAIAIQVARGLVEAHAHGIIHRDIKPSNILLTTQGVVKIVDFGLASVSGAGELTLAGARMGSPPYMSPEQALGLPVDHRTDIWSLGVVLLEMLTQRRVFEAESTPSVLYKVVHGEVPLLGYVRGPCRSLLAKALEKEPAKRYKSVRDFLTAMEAIQPESVEVRPPSSAAAPKGLAASSRAGARRWRDWRLGLAAAVLLILIAGAAVYFRQGHWPVVAGGRAPSSVFDKYLQGVELTKRWDKEGNLDRAIALLTDATRSDPSFALGYARLAEAQRVRYGLTREKGSLDAAVKNAEEAMRLNPELAPVQVAWGRVQASRGNSDLAMASFEHALRIDANDADAHLAIGRQYERLGRLTDAEAAYRKAGALDPDGVAVHDSYANFLFRQSRYADAIREWRTAVRIAPDDAAVLVNLGAALSDSGSIEEAIATYKQALQLKPTDMGYSNLGTAYYRMRRYQEAVAAYRDALKLSDNNYLFWGNLAGVYARMKGSGDQTKQTFARAIELAEQSRKDNPRDPSVHGSLATYYAEAGNAPLAWQRIETALTLAPNNPEIQAQAAEVYEAFGQHTKALAFAKEALALGYPRQELEQNPDLSHVMAGLK